MSDKDGQSNQIKNVDFHYNNLSTLSPLPPLPSKIVPTSCNTPELSNKKVDFSEESKVDRDEKKEVNVSIKENDDKKDDQCKTLIEKSSDSIVIKADNIHKTYLLGLEGIAALRGVSLEVYKGEFVCLFGTSGGGKTTMLNIIGMIDKPTRGSIYINNTRIKNSTPDSVLASIRLSQMGFVFQTFNLINSLTAIENVELPMQLKGELNRKQIREHAIKLLTDVGLEERINHFPRQLSGGEQQRVTIARAIANNPSILLLDEPTGDLDTKNTDIVMNILIELNRTKEMTMIMVTHDLNLKNFGHRIFRIIDGKLGSIEIIPSEVREEQIRNLKESIEKHATAKLKIREGIMDGSDVKATTECPLVSKIADTTTIRKKDCYKFFVMKPKKMSE